MNVIFLDFDGVISTHHDFYDEKLNRVPEEIYRKNKYKVNIKLSKMLFMLK